MNRARAGGQRRAQAAWLGAAALFVLCTVAPGTAHAEEGGFIWGPSVWVSVAYQGWAADERFAGESSANPSGEVEPLKRDVPQARFRTDQLWLKARVAPVERLLIAAAMPVVQRSEFEQTGTRTVTEGTGDLFTTVGYQLAPMGSEVSTALYVHAVFPTTQLELEDLSLPLSEGQVDLSYESATTWAVLPELHLTASLAYRYRFEVTAEVGATIARIKPGNEVEAAASIGGAPIERLWLETRYLATWAVESEDRTVRGAVVPIEKRQIHWWGANAYYKFGGWFSRDLEELAIDLKFRYPLAGVDFLRGPQLGAGLAWARHWP